MNAAAIYLLEIRPAMEELYPHYPELTASFEAITKGTDVDDIKARGMAALGVLESFKGVIDMFELAALLAIPPIIVELSLAALGQEQVPCNYRLH